MSAKRNTKTNKDVRCISPINIKYKDSDCFIRLRNDDKWYDIYSLYESLKDNSNINPISKKVILTTDIDRIKNIVEFNTKIENKDDVQIIKEQIDDMDKRIDDNSNKNEDLYGELINLRSEIEKLKEIIGN